MVSRLIQCDMIVPNPSAAWACEPLLVSKTGPTGFRITVDLCAVNDYIVLHHFPMLNIEQELTSVSGSKIFAKFDCPHVYWQCSLAADSQESQSFTTPDGVYTLTRVLHGTTSAVTNLQFILAEIITNSFRKHSFFWFNDILLHRSATAGLPRALRELFAMCAIRNLILHTSKGTLYTTAVQWCGRHLSANGVRFDSSRMNELLAMKSPSIGAHLQQFICALQWVRQGIPKFSNTVSPL